MKKDLYINNLAKIYICAVIQSRVIRKSVLSKFSFVLRRETEKQKKTVRTVGLNYCISNISLKLMLEP